MIKKIACLVIVCSFFIHAKPAETPMFPEIQGWKMKVDEKVYNSGDLWELINGAADIFLSYYFEDLHIAEYTKKDQMIRVELYRHKTTDDTYGIYTAERMPDYTQVPIGAQGYKSQGVLNFMAGNYYVKVMSAGVEEVNEQIIGLVAEKVNATMKQTPAMPEELKFFPEEGQITLSDSYVAQNFLGYSFFRNAFSVKYEQPVPLQMFIIRLSPDEIKKMVDQYVQVMKEDHVELKDGVYIVKDLFNGTVFLKADKNYLIGVVNTENESIARDLIGKTESRMN